MKKLKEIFLSNLSAICLWLVLIMLFLFRFVGKGLKYFDVVFFLLLGLFFIVHVYLRKEILVMQIIKENKNLKKEELMMCDYAFLRKALYFTRIKKREIKKIIEIENKILEEILED